MTFLMGLTAVQWGEVVFEVRSGSQGGGRERDLCARGLKRSRAQARGGSPPEWWTRSSEGEGRLLQLCVGVDERLPEINVGLDQDKTDLLEVVSLRVTFVFEDQK